MTTSKTSSFYLTETVTIPNASASGTRVQAELDIGGLVNIASSEALAIESVDFIVQVGSDFAGPIKQSLAADGSINGQLTDQNPGTAFVRADDNNMIASMHLDVDHTNNVGTSTQDFYPDNFGKLSESFFAVNDTLYLVGGIDATTAADNIFLTVRVKARIAKLSKSDWMSLAIQSTANSD